MTTQLVRYEAACKALAEARSVDEVRDVRDKSEAIRAYARQAKNKQLEVDAAEIRLRAERKLGELIQKQKETVGLNRGAAAGGKKDGPRGAYTEPRDSAPTLAEAGIDKKLSSRAQKLAAVPEKEFEGMLGDWRERVSSENERVTTSLLRRGERAQRDSKMQQPDIPPDKYEVIYADPPWRYEYSKSESRDIENQYPTMSLDEICALPVSKLTADDCVLFLWATSPKLEDSMRVLSSWGFGYRTCAVWDKERQGMGYYFRQQHELLLVATKGKPGVPEPSARKPSVIRERRDQKHSKKPESVRALIESMYPDAKRIELFARDAAPGWDVWGNEAKAA